MPDAFKADCLLCGKPLVYLPEPRLLSCALCEQTLESGALCEQGHYICESCHSSSANDLIEHICITSKSTKPLELAVALMNSPAIRMHGPEHHFLVPAVLLAAYYNGKLNPTEKAKKVRMARQRAENVLGGFCGFYGACGAAIGTGIFISLITDSSPLSTETWGLANRMTSESLHCIAALGGPRCCKRGAFLALRASKRFVSEHLHTKLNVPDVIVCQFSEMNHECLQRNCPFHPDPSVSSGLN